MSQERDTHFAGFAKIQWNEIENKIMVADNSLARFYHPLAPGVSREMELLIARRAYDLVAHALNGDETLQWKPLEEISVKDIPDLTEWTFVEEAEKA